METTIVGFYRDSIGSRVKRTERQGLGKEERLCLHPLLGDGVSDGLPNLHKHQP